MQYRLSPILLAISLLTACGTEETSSGHSAVANNEASVAAPAGALNTLTVYKSPTCGCCEGWIEHANERGFQTQAVHPSDLTGLKQRFGVPINARSCHTAVSANGYVFEGHVPAHFIHEFLANPPADAIGLTVPAMPVGTPGMEMDNKFMPYQVLIMKKDGSHEVLASVNDPESQYQ